MKVKYFVETRSGFFDQFSKRAFEDYLVYSVKHDSIDCYYSQGILYHLLNLRSNERKK